MTESRLATRLREEEGRWLAAMDKLAAAREAALQASGLPECVWIARANAAPPPTESAALLAHVERVNAHTATCRFCAARERFLSDRFGPMPKPPDLDQLRLLAPIERLAPVPKGAAVLGILASLFAIPVLIGAPSKLDRELVFILVSTSAGAAGGFVYSRSRPFLKRLGRLGYYVTGVAFFVALLGGGPLLLSIASGEPPNLTPPSLVAFGATALFFGLLVGHRWNR